VKHQLKAFLKQIMIAVHDKQNESIIGPNFEKKQYDKRQRKVNQNLSNHLQKQQPLINQLVAKQKIMTGHVKNWNIDTLNGGFVSSDPSYIDSWIKIELIKN
jgi:hypothetical protein